MIVGAHVMLQSRNPSADKAFFGGVLNLPSVDVGGGFIIFGIPPAAGLALSLVQRMKDVLFGVPGLLAWQGFEGNRLWRLWRGRKN